MLLKDGMVGHLGESFMGKQFCTTEPGRTHRCPEHHTLCEPLRWPRGPETLPFAPGVSAPFSLPQQPSSRSPGTSAPPVSAIAPLLAFHTGVLLFSASPGTAAPGQLGEEKQKRHDITRAFYTIWIKTTNTEARARARPKTNPVGGQAAVTEQRGSGTPHSW